MSYWNFSRIMMRRHEKVAALPPCRVRANGENADKSAANPLRLRQGAVGATPLDARGSGRGSHRLLLRTLIWASDQGGVLEGSHCKPPTQGCSSGAAKSGIVSSDGREQYQLMSHDLTGHDRQLKRGGMKGLLQPAYDRRALFPFPRVSSGKYHVREADSLVPSSD